MRTIFPALAVSAISVACGGTSDEPRGAAPDGGTAPQTIVDAYSCEELATAYEFLTFEEFEATDVASNAMRTVGWYVNDDGTNPNRSPLPPAIEVTVGVPPTPGGAPSFDLGCQMSPQALRLFGGPPGFKNFGYVFGATYTAPPATSTLPDVRDASDWEGLAFWARRGESTEPRTITATVTDQYTLSGMFCIESLDVQTACDAFGRGVGLDTRWRLVLMPFDEAIQQGYGRPSLLDGPEVAALTGLNFGIGTGTFEVWVDGVAYYRSRP